MHTPNMFWTQDEAIALCCQIEAIVPAHGCHVALTGGLLYKTGPRKDADILLYRIREHGPVDFAALFRVLEMRLGIELVDDFDWCKKATWNGKSIDFFDPDADGKYGDEEAPEYDDFGLLLP